MFRKCVNNALKWVKRVENALILKLKRAKNVVNLSTGFDLENRVQKTLQHIF